MFFYTLYYHNNVIFKCHACSLLMLRHICSRVHSEWFQLGLVHLNCFNNSFISDLETSCAFSKKKNCVYTCVCTMQGNNSKC